MPRNGPTAKTYPTEEQYTAWKDRADELGMSISEFIANMVEAGWKKFDASVEPDETKEDLREQRNDLKLELERERDRIRKLEDALHNSERAIIQQYVQDNPGASWTEINQHLADKQRDRTTYHLEELEGEELRRDENGDYYPPEEGDS